MMVRVTTDNKSEFSVSDLTKRKQNRREAKVEWSDRMLNHSTFTNSSVSFKTASNAADQNRENLKSQFFGLLMGDSARIPESAPLQASNFGGTKEQNCTLNKQGESKNGVQVNKYEVATQDFGKATVEVHATTSQIYLTVLVDQMLPAKHSKILEQLVASRLGLQFGKSFEVQIKCKT